MQAYQRATDSFDDVVGQILGLNPADLRCLDWLTEGERSVGEIAALTGLSSAATTTMLDRLERKGFVRRRRAQDDRRKVNVALTASGRRRLGELYGPLAAAGESMLSGLDDATIVAMVDFMEAARQLVERQTHELRSRSKGSNARRGR